MPKQSDLQCCLMRMREDGWVLLSPITYSDKKSKYILRTPFKYAFTTWKEPVSRALAEQIKLSEGVVYTKTSNWHIWQFPKYGNETFLTKPK